MSSYKDLPLDVEKYSLSPFLSSKDISSLSVVDRKRRDLYDITYWNRRFLTEEGEDLFDYEDGSSAYIRYSRAKTYLEARRRFESILKELFYYSYDSSSRGDDIPSLEKELTDSFTTMIKYADPSQVPYIVKRLEYIHEGFMDHLFFDSIWETIIEYGRLPFIKEAFDFVRFDETCTYSIEDIIEENIVSILEKGKINTLQVLGVSKHQIIKTLLIEKDFEISKENLIKILEYTSKLEGKVGNLEKSKLFYVGSNGGMIFYVYSDKKELVELLEKNYPSLLPPHELGFND